MVCETCGLVLDDAFIDQGPEWRAFDSEQREKRARTGAPMSMLIHDKGLSTMIGWKNKDSYGKSIPTRNRAQLYRLRKWQRRIRVSNATERNLAFALSELDRMASGMGLPRNVRETAAMVYRRAVTKNLIRGRSIEGVVAASLYAACRQCEPSTRRRAISRRTPTIRSSSLSTGMMCTTPRRLSRRPPARCRCRERAK